MIEYLRPEKGYTAPAPFKIMGTADYAPYPLHTPLLHSNSHHRRRNMSNHSQFRRPRANTQSSTSSSATASHSLRGSRYMHLAKRDSRPCNERIDSGFENQSETSSITFTDEVEKRFELQEFLRARHDDSGEAPSENEDKDEDEDEGEDETGEEGSDGMRELAGGELGRKARDSIDINIGRAESWESKEKRTKKNERSLGDRLKVVRKWVRGLVSPRNRG